MTVRKIDKAKKKAYQRRWYEENIEHIKNYRKKYNKENRARERERARIKRASRSPEQIEHDRTRAKQSRDRRRESIREASRLDRAAKPEVHVLHSLRTKCRRKKMAFNLTPDDVVAPECCPIFGIKLQRGVHSETKRKGPADCSPSVDRIIPELGYVKGNVIVVSHLANRIRNDATPEQIHAVADFYEKLLSERGYHEN